VTTVIFITTDIEYNNVVSINSRDS